MKHINRISCLLIAVAGITTSRAQEQHTIYYREGQKLMQGRWTYQGNGALDLNRHNFYYVAQEGTGMGIPLLQLPGYRPDLDKDNLVLLHLHCDGLIRLWYPDGTLKTEISYNNGVQHGPYIRYYPNGKTALEGTLHQGMPKGIWKSYYDNGQLYFSGSFTPYTQAELETRWQKMADSKYAYEDELELYIRDKSYAPETYMARHAFDTLQPGVGSKKDGVFNFYGKDGRIIAAMAFHDNIPHGAWRKWDGDTLILELQYNMGALEHITERGKRLSAATYIAEKKKEWRKMQQYGVVAAAEELKFITVEQTPEFPGRPEDYIRKQIRYPEGRQRYLDSSVTVHFYVNEDGSVSDVQVVKPVYAPFDREVIRVIKGMPRWKPGRKNGVPVRVAYTLKVGFGLTTDFVR